jgi:hypothetical protein
MLNGIVRPTCVDSDEILGKAGSLIASGSGNEAAQDERESKEAIHGGMLDFPPAVYGAAGECVKVFQTRPEAGSRGRLPRILLPVHSH